MKWVKHMTDCAQDPKIRQVRAYFGNDGYAAYWLIVESIGANFSKRHPHPELTFPPKVWAKICEISAKKLKNFLEFSENINLLEHKYHKESLTIKVPNLLKHGDEYTRKQAQNSGQTPDNVGTNSGHTPDSVRASSSTSSSPSPNQGEDISTEYLGAGNSIDPETGEVIRFAEGAK